LKKTHNILFLSSWYPNKTTPQAGNFIQKHAQAVALYCNVIVLHVVSRVQSEEFVIETHENSDITEIIIYYKKTSFKTPIISSKIKLNSLLKAYRRGLKMVKSYFDNIDLVHVNVSFPAGIFALELLQKLKIPFIISEHWTAFLPSDPIKFNLIEKHFIKKITQKATCICPVSESLKKEMINFGIKNKFKIIPNVVDTSIFKPNINKKNKLITNFLHISNLNDVQKNISGMLNAIKMLSEVRNDFKVTIVGDGDVEKFILKAKKIRIPENIIVFENTKSSKEIAKLMNESDVLLMFSNYETFSVVIAEAWASGLPVISSKCGGLTENINKENGILVAPKNEKQLFLGLNNMIDNLSNYNLKEIAEKSKEKYSYQNVGKKYFQLYNTILKH